MKPFKSIPFILFSLLCCLPATGITIAKGVSVYRQQINDPEAVCFTPEHFSITADEKAGLYDVGNEILCFSTFRLRLTEHLKNIRKFLK